MSARAALFGLMIACVPVNAIAGPAASVSSRFREQQLWRQLAAAAPPARSTARMALARHYLEMGRPADALGMLDIVKRGEPSAVLTSAFLETRGRASLGLRHYAEAARDLDAAALDGRADVWLLRARLAEQSGAYGRASQAFARGAAGFAALSRPEFTLTTLSAARTQLALGQSARALRFVSYARHRSNSSAEQAHITLLRGQIAAAQNKPLDAARYFAVAQVSSSRETAARAGAALVRAELASGKLLPAKAIAALEQLRFAWRGDDLELQLLDQLGDLQAAANNARAALGNWRIATRYFPLSAQTRRIAAKQQALFTARMARVPGSQSELIANLALFSDFRELTPLGNSGDALIRKLVDQLMAAGLANRAAGILAYQVEYRLVGTAQASVAVELAALQTDLGSPAKALELLRRTQGIEVAPEIAAQRRAVMAGAALGTGDVDRAADLIADDATALGDALRSDIAWRRQDWAQVKVRSGALARATRAPRQILRIAYALHMLGDAAGLRAVTRDYAALLVQPEHEAALAMLAKSSVMTPADIRKLGTVLQDIDALTPLLPALKGTV